VFDGPDADPLALDEVRALPPEALTVLPLALVPCHRLLAHPFAIEPLWRALDAGQSGEAAAQPEIVIIWRQDIEVHHRAVDDEEGRLLARTARGTTLAALCEQVDAPTDEEGAHKVFQILGRWLADGLLVRAD
jgi:hypothetical protein